MSAQEALAADFLRLTPQERINQVDFFLQNRASAEVVKFICEKVLWRGLLQTASNRRALCGLHGPRWPHPRFMAARPAHTCTPGERPSPKDSEIKTIKMKQHKIILN